MTTRAKTQAKGTGRSLGAQSQKPSKTTILAPVSKGVRLTVKPPTYPQSTEGGGAVRIRHTEYIRDIPQSTGFALQTGTGIAINPGNDQFGVWISDIAMNWEEYKIHSLQFRIEPLVSTSTAGIMMAYIDYDAADPPAQTKQDFMANKGAMRCSTWDTLTIKVDKKDADTLKKRFTLNTLPPAGQDVRLFNLGNLHIGTFGGSSTNAGAELYVDYDIELCTPQSSHDADQQGALTGQTNGKSTNPLRGLTLTPAIGNCALVANNLFNTLQFNDTGVFDILINTYLNSGTNLGVNPATTVQAGAATFQTLQQGFNQSGLVANGLSALRATVTQSPAQILLDFGGLSAGAETINAMNLIISKFQ